jgi:SAM-dependent methyltransferase
MKSRRVQALRERLFGQRLNDWQTYHALIARRLRPGMTVVEVGPGKGTIAPFPWDAHRGIHLIGLDLDVQAAANPYLDRFEFLSEGMPWPVADGSADLVVARYVLEHVADPDDFMANVARVLRPGGAFVFLTPNRAHPIMVASRLLPYSVHVALLARTKGSDAGDVFPTHYRANSRRALIRLARAHGLEVQGLKVAELVPFGYLDFAVPGFLAATAYHAAVTLTDLDRFVGLSIIGVLGKPARVSL